jgi:hypothetical protein
MRKWAAMFLCSMLSTVAFFAGIMYTGSIWAAVGLLFASIIVAFPLANMLLKHPFRDMVEGKGILAMDINSTGIIRPFIVRVNTPYIQGKIGKTQVNDIFNRESVFNMASPQVNSTGAEIKDGRFMFNLDKEEFNTARFGLYTMPVLIYNSQLASFITKDFLSNKEMDVYAQHGVLYLNRKMEELSSHIRDFGRYIVEMLKPKSGFNLGGWLIWIILIIGFGALIAVFWPTIVGFFKGGTSVIGGAASTASQTITPR